MSSNNDEKSAVIMVVAFIGAVMMAIAIFIMALLAFAAFVLTILSIFAWNRPLRLGRIVITPEEARGFVYRGIAGALLVPAFLAFMTLLFDLNIEWSYLLHFMLAGYVGGSIGLEILFAQEEPQGGGPVHYHPAPPAIPAPTRQTMLAPPEAPPFRYASWDDEEGRGQ